MPSKCFLGLGFVCLIALIALLWSGTYQFAFAAGYGAFVFLLLGLNIHYTRSKMREKEGVE